MIEGSTPIQFRAGELAPGLSTRVNEDTSHNTVARTMAERYAEMCSQALPFFSGGQWEYIWLCIQSHDLNFESAERIPRIVRAGLAHDDSKTVGDVGNVDSFISRLDRMDYAACCASFDYCELYEVTKE